MLQWIEYFAQGYCPWPWSLVVLRDKTGVLGPGLGSGWLSLLPSAGW